jgi:von Willebrand factor type A domain
MTFLTPLAALVALAAVAPALAFLLGGRRLAQVRTAVGLRARPLESPVTAAAAYAVVVILGVAAAQPAWKSESRQRVRTDVQALFVVDISQSMAASGRATGPTRLRRAIGAAEQLRRAIPQVACGVATLTDRVLPDLLPVADAAAFDATLTRSVAIEEPPPQSTDVRATSFGALATIPARDYFPPETSRKLVVLLTDGESAPYDAGEVRRAFANANVDVVGVRFWSADEQIFDARGRIDTAYRPDPRGAELLRALGGATFDEGELGAASQTLRKDAGSGPTKTTGRAEAIHPLGPWVALVALLPLALVFRRRGLLLPATGP